MSHITPEQLTHLAKLSRIELSSEDEQHLLPQLEKIIEFVGKFQEYDLSGDEAENDLTLRLATGVESADLTDSLLANVKHPIVEQSIAVQGKLSET